MKPLNEQYDESLVILLHRIGTLKSAQEKNIPHSTSWFELRDRISALENMLDDVYIQANGAREYKTLWGTRATN